MSLRLIRACSLLIALGAFFLHQSYANDEIDRRIRINEALDTPPKNARGQIYQKTTRPVGAPNGTAASWMPNDCLGLGQSISARIEAIFRTRVEGLRAQLVNFYMTSRAKPKKVLVTAGNQFGLDWTDFRPKRDTVLIVHGFLSNGEEPWIVSMAQAFLKLGDYNVIAVDWSVASETYNYYKAVVNTQTTGNQIATLFDQIEATLSKPGEPRVEQWGRIHCVGHSLGAHICGYAANEMKRRNSSWSVRRITGLDPAQPCFHTAELALKLDKRDAPFVDVIHTNGRFLSQLGLGLPDPVGHVDFFPNGGRQQPGCQIVSGFTIPIISIPTSALSRAICNHGRSYIYFTESIINAATNKCTFWAQPWDRTYRDVRRILVTTCKPDKPGNCMEMGINSDKYDFKGTYFALTAATEPFCDPGYKDRDEVISGLKDDFGDAWED